MKTHAKALVIRIALLALFAIALFELKHSLLIKFTIVSPLPENGSAQEILTKKVMPRLAKTKNTFHLTHDFSLVPKVEAEDVSLDVSSYLLVDIDTGKILSEKNSAKKLPIASLTKIMSAVVALDLAKNDDIYIVSANAAKTTPTRIGVVPQEEMKMEELLKAMLMTSANDAAQVLKEGIDEHYQAPVFIAAMNEKARFLGLQNTHFANPQGFDNPDNYSSAEDLAVLIKYALTNYPILSGTVKEGYDFLPQNNLHKQFDLPNWNGLIGVYPEVIGVKIGNTEKAGMTTAVVSQRGGKKLLAVVLGAKDIFSRDMQAAALLDMGYEKTLGLKPIEITRTQLQEKYNSWYQR